MLDKMLGVESMEDSVGSGGGCMFIIHGKMGYIIINFTKWEWVKEFCLAPNLHLTKHIILVP